MSALLLAALFLLPLAVVAPFRSALDRREEPADEAERDAQRFGDGLPAVFHRRNREGWRVTMALPDWLELYRSYQPPRDSNHGR